MYIYFQYCVNAINMYIYVYLLYTDIYIYYIYIYVYICASPNGVHQLVA